MPLSNTSSNYLGRKVDLSLFPGLSEARHPAPLEFTAPIKAIAGASKAAQNFLRLLLTPLGYYKSDPSLGSRFYTTIIQGGLRYPSDLAYLFSTESQRVLSYLQTKVYTSDTLPDEVIRSLSLLNYSTDRTHLKMDIAVTFGTGETFSLLLPVVWNI